MQPVPALGTQRVAAQFVVAGHTPDVGSNGVFLGQNFLRPQRLVQNRTATEQLHHSLAVGGFAIFVDALQDAFFASLGYLGHGVVFVVQRDVVEAVFAEFVHAANAIMHDDSDLVHVRRVVGVARRNGAGQHDAVAVLVLQPFAGEGSATGGAAHQEALTARIR